MACSSSWTEMKKKCQAKTSCCIIDYLEFLTFYLDKWLFPQLFAKVCHYKKIFLITDFWEMAFNRECGHPNSDLKASPLKWILPILKMDELINSFSPLTTSHPFLPILLDGYAKRNSQSVLISGSNIPKLMQFHSRIWWHRSFHSWKEVRTRAVGIFHTVKCTQPQFVLQQSKWDFRC